MDYRRMFDDKDLLYSYDLDDLNGRDLVVQIESVKKEQLTGRGGKKSFKPHIKFVGHDKRYAASKTSAKTIAKLYGKDASKWPGKWIALFVTTTEDPEDRSQIVDCIRVRPVAPASKRARASADSLVEQFGRVATAEEMKLIEAETNDAWQSLSRDDKLRVKLAADEARGRVAPPADEPSKEPAQ